MQWIRLFVATLVLLMACKYYPARTVLPPPITCGNGRLDPGEVCDGEQLDGQTCETTPVPGLPGQTFYRGTLGCKPNCLELDTSSCSGFCGDDVIDQDAPDGPEVCDGTDVAGHTCATVDSPNGQPYYGGAVTCAADCKSFDTSQCTGYCGDDIIQADHAEQCDTAQFGGDSCERRGFYEGQLKCTSDCKVDPSDCNGVCGDGIVQSQFGESCDGDATITATCQSLGFYSGQVTCTRQCTVDTSECTGYCGDQNCDSNFGENCKTCPEDCPCGIFGNCGPDGVCICVTKPFTFVDCNNGCGVSETVDVNCQVCGDPSCDVITPTADGVTWHYYPTPPDQYVQCGLPGTSTAGQCFALSGEMYFPDGCEPFFTLDHLDGCSSDLQECTQTFIDQLQADGLWPPGRARFGAENIHTVTLQENLMCEPRFP